MRLTDASVAIRPRSAWEALDLGILLARRHAGLLMLSWALTTLPLLAILSWLFWDSPVLAFVLFWWLKPLFERLPLFILSRALFSATPTLKQSLKAFPGLLRRQALASLTWRRFSPTRSFSLPVTQLEGLDGKPRNQRLQQLEHASAGQAFWLTLLGVYIESILLLAQLSLLYLMLPESPAQSRVMEALAWSDSLGFEHLGNLCYALVLVVWEPLYVSCGFMLYLNRRSQLEAWDLELAFRRLQQRLGTVVPALLLVGLLGLASWSPPTLAAPPAAVPATPCAQQSLPLDTCQARRDIFELVNAPPFQTQQVDIRWGFGSAETEPDQTPWKNPLNEAVLKKLTLFMEVLLWLALLLGVGLLLFKHKQWLRLFALRPRSKSRPQAAPGQLFGLDLAPESLPDDICAQARSHWHTNPREVLGLFYRALLSRLLHQEQLPLKRSYTEQEVMQLIEHHYGERPQTRFARLLTPYWQATAYGHMAPPEALCEQLCQAWQELLEATTPGQEVSP